MRLSADGSTQERGLLLERVPSDRCFIVFVAKRPLDAESVHSKCGRNVKPSMKRSKRRLLLRVVRVMAQLFRLSAHTVSEGGFLATRFYQAPPRHPKYVSQERFLHAFHWLRLYFIKSYADTRRHNWSKQVQGRIQAASGRGREDSRGRVCPAPAFARQGPGARPLSEESSTLPSPARLLPPASKGRWRCLGQ